MLNAALASLARLSRLAVAVGAAALLLGSLAWVATRPWRAAQARGTRVELTLMNWSGGGGQQEEQIVADVIARFERDHPGVTVRRINPGDAGSFNTKLQTMMAAGVPPDVFYMSSERFAVFARHGTLAPLEPFIAADRAAGRPTLDLDDFFANTVDNFRFDGRTTGRGTLYGIPKDFTTWGFYYNKDLFDRAGVPYPADDWTWDDFIAAARQIGQLPNVLGGAEISCWDDPIRAYLWTYGLDLVDEQFRSRVFEPPVYERLRTLWAWRFEERGTLVSGDSQVAQGQDIFVTGRVGLVGPLGRWVVPRYREIRDFRWDFALLPRGTAPANLVATVAWSMSARTKHPDEAWRLLKYLCGAEGQRRVAELGLAIPTLKSVAYSEAFADPRQLPERDDLYLRAAEYARIATIPGYPEWKSTLTKRLEEFLRAGKPVDETLRRLEADWAQERANPLLHADYPPLRWDRVTAAVAVPTLLLAVLLGVGWFRGRPGRLARREERAGYAFVSPWVLGFAAFLAFPIVLSLILSFCKWTGFSPLSAAQWVGWDNFRYLLLEDPRFWSSLRVTAYYALIAVPGGQLLALAAALLMNHQVRFAGFFRSAWYLPSVLAGVGVAILWRWVFDGEVGLINTYLLGPLCRQLNVALGLTGDAAFTPPRWFTADARLFGPPAFAIMSFWAFGGTMVIYLAGLKGIPRELYEAAAIDGSSAWQRFRNVTLPMLSPIIFFNVIMAIIGSFQVFTQAFVMTGGGPGDDTRFYVLYLYTRAFDDSHMGYGSALAWLLLLIVLGLTLLVMRGSRRFVYYEGLR